MLAIGSLGWLALASHTAVAWGAEAVELVQVCTVFSTPHAPLLNLQRYQQWWCSRSSNVG
jgi:hypothetical protein